jgi:hypothetical protein
LKKFNEINIDEETEKKLMDISPATIDRLLKNEKMKFRLRGRSLTKPGTLLKHSIPIRTFADWDEKEPGFGTCGKDYRLQRIKRQILDS